jgi:hypothetical protein
MPTRRNSAPVVRPWLIIVKTPPSMPWVVSAKIAEHDEAEVRDRRVRDEPFQVGLHRGDDAP